MTTESPNDPSEPSERAQLSRRRMIGGAAVGAGALWVAPSVIGLATPAAAVSAQAVPTFFHGETDDQNRIDFGMVGPGVVVAVLALRTSFSTSLSPALSGGLTSLWGNTFAGAGLLNVRAWAGVLGAPTNMSATWSSGPLGTEYEGAGIVAVYPTGIGREPAGTVSPASGLGTSMGTTNNVAIAGPNRRTVFLGGHTDTATFTQPAGFGNVHTFGNGAVTAFFADRQQAAGPATVNGVTGNLGTIRGWVAGQAAVI